ncbi:MULTISPECIES: DUF4145 domain-containing protein [unclassified Leisingera]|uniref:DUF4145 domain-containing protein n=1 Tax=unclassified Leisingera TaxID=2614906 RepID=UPI00138DE0C2|nr:MULTISPECIES: DUF4145 domain-containing protein [unclassified Leisingera]
MNSGYQHYYTDFEKDSVVYDFSELREARLVPENKLTAPEHLPSILNDTYLDAEFNFSSSRWKAAAQLYLQSIEFACIAAKAPHDEIESQSLSAQRMDLTKRINILFDEGLITERMKNWAHKIRVLGQYHKHRYVEANEDDTKDIREFCELFLKYLFTMPGLIQSREERLEARKVQS